MSLRQPEVSRVLIVGATGPWAPPESRACAAPEAVDLGWADLVILSAPGPQPWEQIRRWRLAGHRFGVVVLGAADEPEDRVPLEPLWALSQPPAEGWDPLFEALRGGPSAMGALQLGPRTADLNRRELRGPEGVEPLTARECELLAYLAARPGRDVGRDELQVQVWRHRKPTLSRAVDMAVMRLRKKIEENPSSPRWLQSSRGDGYRLVVDLAAGDPETAPAAPAPPRRAWSGPPSPSGRLFGREDLRRAVSEAINRGERLITLTGPPGAGKTALASALGRDPSFAPACWVDLSPVRHSEGLRLAVAAALGLDTGQLRTAADLDARLDRALGEAGHALVVLDNAEHVLEPVIAAIRALSAAAPQARLLVTSQVRLGLRGERVIELTPLEPEHAAALFLDRAAAVGAPPVTDEDDVALQHVLECLDYLPLSLELAAARTRALSLPELAAALSDRLGALRKGPRDAPHRHSSLRAALSWSWGLLSAAEQDALGQLSVFEGAFDLAKAAVVLDLSPWPEGAEALDAVEALLDRSLVRRVSAEGSREARYSLLGSVAAFAREQSPAARLDAARARHRVVCVARARAMLEGADHEDVPSLVARLYAEAADWSAAMEGASDADRVALACALDGLYQVRGTLEQRLRALDLALREARAPEAVAELLLARGRARMLHSPDPAAEQDLLESERGFEAQGMSARQAIAVSVRADLLSRRGDMRGALELCRRAAEICRVDAPEQSPIMDANEAYFSLILRGGQGPAGAAVQTIRRALALTTAQGKLRAAYRHAVQLGIVLEELGDASGASDARRTALRFAERLQAPTLLGGARLHVALDALTARDYPAARAHLAAARAITTEAGDLSRLPYVQYYQIVCDLNAGEDCRARLEDLAERARQLGERRTQVYVLLSQATDALCRGDLSAAARYAERCRAGAEALGLAPLVCGGELLGAIAAHLGGAVDVAGARRIAEAPSGATEDRALATLLWWASALRTGEDPCPARAGLRALLARGSWPDRAAYEALTDALERGPAPIQAARWAAGDLGLSGVPSSAALRIAARVLAGLRFG